MDDIDEINAEPMERLRFRDFVRLKSGGDQFSRCKVGRLREAVSHAVVEAVRETFADDDKMQASCLRWVLRGLNVDKAIRKVKSDAEVTANAIGGRLGTTMKPWREPSDAEYDAELRAFAELTRAA